IKDWCISRQLWWGHRVPVWSKSATSDEVATLERSGSSVLLDQSEKPLGFAVCLSAKPGAASFVRPEPPDPAGIQRVFVSTDSTDEAAAWEKLGFAQDPDVLDTWC